MTAADDGARRRSAAVAALAAAAWLPSLLAPFQFDDYNAVLGDPGVFSWRVLAATLTSAARPLLRASYALSASLGGGAPGFRLFNVAVHAVNAVLLYRIGRRLTARWGVPDGAALAAALLFALHPAQAEAVTYVCGRSVSLMASFYLGAMFLYLRGASAAAPAALFVAALAVKETAVTLPAALLLAEACAPRVPDWRAVLRRQAPVWLVLPAAALVLLVSARYRDLLTYGFTERGAWANLRAQAGGVWYLLARLTTLRGFNIDPGLVPASAWTPASAAKAAALAALLGAGLAGLRRRSWTAFGLLWFFLQLAPTNSVVPRLDVANDRQLYLACWGPFLALCVEASRLRVPRRALAGAAAALLAAFAAASWSRQREFRSETALWEASVRENPDNARARNDLGQAYEADGRRADARAQYREALRLSPGYVKAGVNLRLLDWEEAGRVQRDSNSGTTQRR